MSIASFITGFGDEAVLLPLALGVGLLLEASGWRRGALAWAIGVGGCMVVVFLLKIALVACGVLPSLPSLRSPSGHTAAATAIYGGLLALAVRRFGGSMRLMLACPVLVALVIGGTRIVLHVHTSADVSMGGLLGLTGALLTVRLAGPPPSSFRLRWVGELCLVVFVVLHGVQLPAEAFIRMTASHVWLFAVCR